MIQPRADGKPHKKTFTAAQPSVCMHRVHKFPVCLFEDCFLLSQSTRCVNSPPPPALRSTGNNDNNFTNTTMFELMNAHSSAICSMFVFLFAFYFFFLLSVLFCQVQRCRHPPSSRLEKQPLSGIGWRSLRSGAARSRGCSVLLDILHSYNSMQVTVVFILTVTRERKVSEKCWRESPPPPRSPLPALTNGH